MVLWPSLVVLWMRGWGEGDTDPEGLSASQWSCCPWVSVKQGEMGSHHLPAGFQPCPMARGSLVKSQRGGGWLAVRWHSDFGLGGVGVLGAKCGWGKGRGWGLHGIWWLSPDPGTSRSLLEPHGVGTVGPVAPGGMLGGHPPHRLFYALLLIPSRETPRLGESGGGPAQTAPCPPPPSLLLVGLGPRSPFCLVPFWFSFGVGSPSVLGDGGVGGIRPDVHHSVVVAVSPLPRPRGPSPPAGRTPGHQ